MKLNVLSFRTCLSGRQASFGISTKINGTLKLVQGDTERIKVFGEFK